MNDDSDLLDGARPPNYAISAGTTRWSLILKSAEADPAGAQRAMTELAEQYIEALYAYVRHKSGNSQDVEDVVHSFFLERLPGLLNAAKQELGSFRGLLRTGLDWWMADARRKETAQKRDVRRISPMPEEYEQLYLQMTAQNMSAEEVYDMAWANVLCAKAMDELEQEAPERERRVLRLMRDGAEQGEDLTREKVAKLAGVSPNAVSQVQRKIKAKLLWKAMDYCRDSRECRDESAFLYKIMQLKAGQ